MIPALFVIGGACLLTAIWLAVILTLAIRRSKISPTLTDLAIGVLVLILAMTGAAGLGSGSILASGGSVGPLHADDPSDSASSSTDAMPESNLARETIALGTNAAPDSQGTAGPGLTYTSLAQLTEAYNRAGFDCNDPDDSQMSDNHGPRGCPDGTWMVMAPERFTPEAGLADDAMHEKARSDGLYFIRLHNAYLINPSQDHLRMVAKEFGGFPENGD